MRFGSQMDYTVKLVFSKQLHDVFTINDICFQKMIIREVFYIFEVGKISGIGKFIKVIDIVLRIFFHE